MEIHAATVAMQRCGKHACVFCVIRAEELVTFKTICVTGQLMVQLWSVNQRATEAEDLLPGNV
jgi:hypothetical protein